MDWYVYDPGYAERAGGPVLYGAFASEAAAWEYANALYPEDGAGSCVVLPLTRP